MSLSQPGLRRRREACALALIAAFILALVPRSTPAADPPPAPEKPRDLVFFTGEELVVVTASRKEQQLLDAAATVHVITEEDIKRSAAPTLADLLRTVPGVEVRTWLAEYLNVNIRGMLGAEVVNTRVLWLVDGMRISDVRDGGVWQDVTVPVDLIKRIEIVLGPGSALYGANAFQGVINIITKSPKEVAAAGDLHSSYSSFDTKKLSYSYAQAGSAIGWTVNASVNETDGPELLPNSNTFKQDYDPHSGRRWYYGRAFLTYGDSFKLSLGHRKAFTDFSGAEFFPAELYQWDRTESHVTALYSGSVGRLELRAEGEYRRFLEEFFDYSDLRGLTNTIDQNKTELDFHVRRPLTSWSELMAGVGYRREEIDADEFRPGFERHTINNPNGFLQAEATVGPWRVTAGGRYDTHERYADQVNPRVNVIWRASDRLRLRAAYGRAFKEPANWQLYILQVDAEGDPRLRPEKLETFEIASAFALTAKVVWRLDAFRTEMRDIILNNWEVTDDVGQFPFGGRFHPRQGGDVDLWGFETQVRGAVVEWADAYVNYSYLRTEDAAGRSLQYDPKHRANLGATLTWEPLAFSTALHYVGATTDTSLAGVPGVGVREVEDYFIWEAKARARLYGDLTVAVRGWNIGGTTHYEMLGVPAPGPVYGVEVSYPF